MKECGKNTSNSFFWQKNILHDHNVLSFKIILWFIKIYSYLIVRFNSGGTIFRKTNFRWTKEFSLRGDRGATLHVSKQHSFRQV